MNHGNSFPMKLVGNVSIGLGIWKIENINYFIEFCFGDKKEGSLDDDFGVEGNEFLGDQKSRKR